MIADETIDICFILYLGKRYFAEGVLIEHFSLIIFISDADYTSGIQRGKTKQRSQAVSLNYVTVDKRGGCSPVSPSSDNFSLFYRNA
ncbi:hypothetical protein ACU60T_24255 [Klebsiella aerogenes]